MILPRGRLQLPKLVTLNTRLPQHLHRHVVLEKGDDYFFLQETLPRGKALHPASLFVVVNLLCYRDVLATISTVAEGTANKLVYDLHATERSFAGARLVVRQSVQLQVGVVLTSPLSRGLFDKTATVQVCAAIPPIIQVPQSQAQR